jgi:two-component system cell cycle response regulator DivK
MLRILIAEDDMDLRNIIHDLLESSGFQTVQAANGQEALTLAAREKPDLLVLDLAMPELDGWQVAKILRQAPSTRDLPIIALTAHAMAGDCEKALQAGCDSYLAKPFVLADLVAEIHRLTERPSPKKTRPSI